MGFIPELDELSFDELTVRFDGAPIDDFADAPQVFYQEVAALLRERDADWATALLMSRATAIAVQPDRLAGALLGLSWRGPSDHACRALLVESLSHRSEVVIQEAIDALAHIEAAEDDQRVAALADHPSPYIRGAVIERLAHDPDPDVADHARVIADLRREFGI